MDGNFLLPCRSKSLLRKPLDYVGKGLVANRACRKAADREVGEKMVRFFGRPTVGVVHLSFPPLPLPIPLWRCGALAVRSFGTPQAHHTLQGLGQQSLAGENLLPNQGADISRSLSLTFPTRPHSFLAEPKNVAACVARQVASLAP